MQFVRRDASSYPGVDLLNGVGCLTPFRRFEINPNGEVTICCYSWLSKICGNILTDSCEEIFNNINRVAILDDMLQGKITYCNDSCTVLGEVLSCTSSNITEDQRVYFVDSFGTSKTYDDIILADRIPNALKKKPYVIYFTYDQSCNLACPTCRNQLVLNKLNKNPLVVNLHQKASEFVDFLLAKGEMVELSITGSGDPFGSPTFRHYLKTLASKPVPKNLGLRLVTNGVLMTPQLLNELKPLWPIIKSITVSTDAATEDTYNVVRKNGNFTKLKENLSNLDSLISSGKILNTDEGFVTHFVVQNANYRELKEYTEWQLQYENSNCIQFALVSKWPHIPDEDFLKMSSMDEDYLREILKDPVFKSHRVTLGNLSVYLT